MRLFWVTFKHCEGGIKNSYGHPVVKEADAPCSTTEIKSSVESRKSRERVGGKKCKSRDHHDHLPVNGQQ